jgi:hypothetical protein
LEETFDETSGCKVFSFTPCEPALLIEPALRRGEKPCEPALLIEPVLPNACSKLGEFAFLTRGLSVGDALFR